MALKLVRFIGSITLGDDNASGIEIGKLSGGSAFRISEFGGQDIFFKITLASIWVKLICLWVKVGNIPYFKCAYI